MIEKTKGETMNKWKMTKKVIIPKVTHYRRFHVPTENVYIGAFDEKDMMFGDQHRIDLVTHWNRLGLGTWIYEVVL